MSEVTKNNMLIIVPGPPCTGKTMFVIKRDYTSSNSPSEVIPVVEEAIRIGAPPIWFQGVQGKMKSAKAQ